MKKSEELHQKARSEENDIKAIGMHLSAYAMERRENNLDEFKKSWLMKLMEQDVAITVWDDGTRYVIESKRQFGTITFYPKANRVLVHRTNNWIRNGLQWLIKNFELK